MNESDFGTRDRRGHWRPNEPLNVGPLLDTPWRAGRVVRWLPAYLLPWNGLFFGIAVVFWLWLTPSREALADLSPHWVLLLFLRNCALVLFVFGTLELRLYVKRRQGARFKYNAAFPADQPSEVFAFRSQNITCLICITVGRRKPNPVSTTLIS